MRGLGLILFVFYPQFLCIRVERFETGDHLLDIRSSTICTRIPGAQWLCTRGICECVCADTSRTFHLDRCHSRKALSMKVCNVVMEETKEIAMTIISKDQISSVVLDVFPGLLFGSCQGRLLVYQAGQWIKPDIIFDLDLLFAEWKDIRKKFTGRLVKGWCKGEDDKCLVLKAEGFYTYPYLPLQAEKTPTTILPSLSSSRATIKDEVVSTPTLPSLSSSSATMKSITEESKNSYRSKLRSSSTDRIASSQSFRTLSFSHIAITNTMVTEYLNLTSIVKGNEASTTTKSPLVIQQTSEKTRSVSMEIKTKRTSVSSSEASSVFNTGASIVLLKPSASMVPKNVYRLNNTATASATAITLSSTKTPVSSMITFTLSFHSTIARSLTISSSGTTTVTQKSSTFIDRPNVTVSTQQNNSTNNSTRKNSCRSWHSNKSFFIVLTVVVAILFT